MRSKKPTVVLAAAMCGSLALAACGGGGPTAAGGKLSNDKVVIGLLNDQSGVYKDLSGPNSKDGSWSPSTTRASRPARAS